jgi:ER degradation enhancer, mannosidase alpha-like 1
VNDSALVLRSKSEDTRKERSVIVKLRFFVHTMDTMFRLQLPSFGPTTEVELTGYTSIFGGDLSNTPPPDKPPLRFRHHDGVRIARDHENSFGCLPYATSHNDTAILVDRGECTFLEKLIHARSAGAAGVVVISHENFGVNPTASEEELAAAGDLSDVAIVVLTAPDGQKVTALMDLAVATGQLMVALDKGNSPAETHGPERVLYLNGHPLLNTRLLV